MLLESENNEAETEALNEQGNEKDNKTTEENQQKYNINGVLEKAYDPEIEQTDAETKALNEKETGSKKTEKDKYNLGICLFGVLNVLLISIIGITAYYVCSEKNVIVVNNADICVPCKDLRLHPDDGIEGIERSGKNRTICCVTETEGPNVLLRYYIDHWLKKKLATDTDRQFVRYKCGDRDFIKPHKPIIKLLGKHELQTAESYRLHWDGDHELAIVPDDDSINHNKESGFIEIKKSGLYQVYSQVILDHDTNALNAQSAPDIYIHSIIKIEADRSHHKSPLEITLMKVTNSHCESKTIRQTITNYLSGAFELSEGDKLAVRVHYKTEVVDVPHMNFFGAHMM